MNKCQWNPIDFYLEIGFIPNKLDKSDISLLECLINHLFFGVIPGPEVVIIKQSGITWMPDESLEPLVKELDDTADPWHAGGSWGLMGGDVLAGSHKMTRTIK